MPLDFPSSPSVNDTYSYGGTTWIWNGTAWYVQAPASINNTPIGNITPSTGAFTTLSSTGNTTLGNIEGNLIPAANVTYNLGSNTARWNDIWLANSTIHIGDANISADGGNLLLPSTIYIGDSPLTESGGSLNLPAGTANVEAGGTANVPKISSVQVTDSSWNVSDDTAIPLEGGYVVINGSGFESTATVYAGETQASAVTFVSSSVLRCQFGAKSAGTYNIFVINPDGGTAIRVNGMTWSSFPDWFTPSTLSTQISSVPINIQLATSEIPSTYALQSGSSLPAGATLSSGGLISGTVTGISADTTYNFTIVATDQQLQDSPRAFSMTVAPPIAAGTLWTWGTNDQGQLGINNTINRSSPAQSGTSSDWGQVVISQYTAAAIKSDGTLWWWGYGSVKRSSPVQVGTATDWKTVSNGGVGTIAAIKTNGTLWMWGDNARGQLGLNDTTGRFSDPVSPTQVGTDTTWDKIALGYYNTMAIKTDGTLWVWGENNNGQLGLGNTVNINRSSPVQVGTDTDWFDVEVTSGLSQTAVMAIKNTRTLWCWGYNNQGQLGLNDTLSRSSPVQVGTGYDWYAISSSTVTSGIKNDGTLWSWGYNANGELGLNDRLNRSSPVQVGSNNNWQFISVGPNGGKAITSSNTLWAWGSGINGSLGLNATTNRSSPTQVGTDTNWIRVSHGYFGGIATRS